MTKKPICLLDLGGVVFQSNGQSNTLVNWDIISNLNNIHGHNLNIGTDVFPDFISDYNQQTGLDLNGTTFLKLLWQTLSFNNELVKLIQNKYDIIIVSDNYRENIEYISLLFKFAEWSIDQYYSFDFALEKSNPLFFEKLLDKINIKGADLIFIDDSQSKLDSAANFGIKGILYTSNENIQKELFHG